MSNLQNLEPQQVYRYFEDLAAIPHGSGNTKAIEAYCMNFAKEHGLSASQDDYGNVVIRKPATPGYEKHKPLILQGHMDMVCEKKSSCPKDMAKEGLTLCTDESWLWAEGTTLGADDGIAVAYILAILADEGTIPHPSLEALFTCDEEVGMLGARALDSSLVQGRTMINIDSETEGVITVSCAGGVRAYAKYRMAVKPTAPAEIAVKIGVDSLRGGHSGIEIHKHRTNAHVLLARILQQLSDRLKTRDFVLAVSSMNGGNKTNVIPKEAEAIVCVSRAAGFEEDEEDFATIRQMEELADIVSTELAEIEINLHEELAATEPGMQITLSSASMPDHRLTVKETARLLFILQQIPDGVMEMNPDIPTMVLTSLNMGEMNLADGILHLGYLVRSNGAYGKQQTVEKLRNFTTFTGGILTLKSDYPVWPYMQVSPLRNKAVEAYKDLFGKEPIIEAIHAGLECGILAGKLGEMDMISIGPTLENVHTPGERMDIDAAKKCWELLLEILRRC